VFATECNVINTAFGLRNIKTTVRELDVCVKFTVAKSLSVKKPNVS
jgi:hypothetical protein